MSTYKPPYTITEKILGLVSSVSEKVGAISIWLNLDSRPHLRRNNRIRSIHSSLKIEANSLSIGEVKDVLEGHTVLGPSREIREVQNAYAAYEKIRDVDPFSLKDLKMMHGFMEQGLLEDAGRFRDGEEGVFNGDTCIFMAPPSRLVPSLMMQLFDWMKAEKRNVHPLIMAAVC